MAGTKLENLHQQIATYLGIPYFSNVGKYQNHGDNVLVGKGTAKEIALKTIEFANAENLKIVEMSSTQLYNFQKKHHLGIDCSGLASHLINQYFDLKLDPRKTSADMLTSMPISTKINPSEIKIGDLIRLDNGHHVLFVIEVSPKQIVYIHSSDKTLTRGVHLGTVDLKFQKFSDITRNGKNYAALYEAVFRPNYFSSTNS